MSPDLPPTRLVDPTLARIVLASSNPGKLREFAALFSTVGVEIVPQRAFDIPEADEPYVTFIENALAKARHASRISGLPAIADDSGLCVRTLNGAPGVHSARYASFAGHGTGDAANNALLVERLAGLADRRAYYCCVLALVRHADDPEPICAEGRWHGEIVDTPRGAQGFGYDPHFHVASLNATVAELPTEVKNTMSHRARALKSLLVRLEDDA